jgi:hypothetical protein
VEGKVKNLFGSRKAGNDGYDAQLRPKGANEMDQRIRAFIDCKEQWQILRRRAMMLCQDSTSGAHGAGAARCGINNVRPADDRTITFPNINLHDDSHLFEAYMPPTSTAADNRDGKEESPSAFALPEALQAWQQRPEPRPAFSGYSVHDSSGLDAQSPYLQPQPEQQLRRSNFDVLMEWRNPDTNSTAVQQESSLWESNLDNLLVSTGTLQTPRSSHFDDLRPFDFLGVFDFEGISDFSDMYHFLGTDDLMSGRDCGMEQAGNQLQVPDNRDHTSLVAPDLTESRSEDPFGFTFTGQADPDPMFMVREMAIQAPFPSAVAVAAKPLPGSSGGDPYDDGSVSTGMDIDEYLLDSLTSRQEEIQRSMPIAPGSTKSQEPLFAQLPVASSSVRPSMPTIEKAGKDFRIGKAKIDTRRKRIAEIKQRQKPNLNQSQARPLQSSLPGTPATSTLLASDGGWVSDHGDTASVAIVRPVSYSDPLTRT